MQLILHAAIFLSVTFLAYWFLLSQKWRNILLVAASIYFMSLFSIEFTVYFLFNIVAIYTAGTYVRKSDANRKLLLKLSLFWLIGNLCVFKYTHVLLSYLLEPTSTTSILSETAITRIAIPLGMSYIVFRLIHYIVEIYRKTLPQHSLWEFASYVIFFPTFIAGPVERFKRFHSQTTAIRSIDTADINYGLFRIISGMLKKFLIADTLTPIIMPPLVSPHEFPVIYVVLSIYGLAIRLYMDFSGYTDMAIGVSRLFGYKIMENFNYPFFKENIAEFWRNWHISVYSFIRDYFFFPFFVYRASQTKIYIGIIVTMIVFMLWHELTVSFLILGIYHGVGLVVWQMFQEVKSKNIKIRQIVDHSYMKLVCILFTFCYVGFSFLFFSFDINSIGVILDRIFL